MPHEPETLPSDEDEAEEYYPKATRAYLEVTPQRTSLVIEFDDPDLDALDAAISPDFDDDWDDDSEDSDEFESEDLDWLDVDDYARNYDDE